MDGNRGMGWGKRAEAATVYLATNQTKRDRERGRETEGDEERAAQLIAIKRD